MEKELQTLQTERTYRLESVIPGNVTCRIECVSPLNIGSWSLGKFHSQGEVDSNPTFKARVLEFLRRQPMKGKRPLGKIYAPSVAEMSGLVVSPEELDVEIKLSNEISVFRNKSVPSDGVPLKIGESFLMSNAGCPAIIATGDDRCVVAHAGRESLIDRGRIQHNSPREYESVVHSILATLGVAPSNVHLHVAFSIPAEAFEHPLTPGTYYAEMIEDIDRLWSPYVDRKPIIRRKGNVAQVSMYHLIRAQARKAGVKSVQEVNTLAPVGHYAHTRHPNVELSQGRNIIRVQRIPSQH